MQRNFARGKKPEGKLASRRCASDNAAEVLKLQSERSRMTMFRRTWARRRTRSGDFEQSPTGARCTTYRFGYCINIYPSDTSAQLIINSVKAVLKYDRHTNLGLMTDRSRLIITCLQCIAFPLLKTLISIIRCKRRDLSLIEEQS